jgi:hypothetical protein
MSDSAALYGLIEKAHAAPEWACFAEVPSATGWASKRRADAVAMCLWPSRGLVIRGFEIKVSRQDFKRESADPTKAEEIAAYCDEWWVVTPRGLIKDPAVELPPAWGLMVPTKAGDKLRTVRAATPTKAKEIGRPFMAAVLRKAHKAIQAQRDGWVRKEEIEDQISAAYERGQSSVDHGAAKRLQGVVDRYDEIFDKLKQATGLDLRLQWGKGDIDTVIERYRVGAAILGDRGSRIDETLRLLKKARDKANESMRAIANIKAGGVR